MRLRIQIKNYRVKAILGRKIAGMTLSKLFSYA